MPSPNSSSFPYPNRMFTRDEVNDSYDNSPVGQYIRRVLPGQQQPGQRRPVGNDIPVRNPDGSYRLPTDREQADYQVNYRRQFGTFPRGGTTSNSTFPGQYNPSVGTATIRDPNEPGVMRYPWEGTPVPGGLRFRSNRSGSYFTVPYPSEQSSNPPTLPRQQGSYTDQYGVPRYYTYQPRFEGDTSGEDVRSEAWPIIQDDRGRIRTRAPGYQPRENEMELGTTEDQNARSQYAKQESDRKNRGISDSNLNSMVDAHNRHAAMTGGPTIQIDADGVATTSDGRTLGNTRDTDANAKNEVRRKIDDMRGMAVYRAERQKTKDAFEKQKQNAQARRAGFANSYQAELFRDMMLRGGGRGPGPAPGPAAAAGAGGGGVFNVGDERVGRVPLPPQGQAAQPPMELPPQAVNQSAPATGNPENPMVGRTTQKSRTAPGVGFNPNRPRYDENGRPMNFPVQRGLNVEGIQEWEMPVLEQIKNTSTPREMVTYLRGRQMNDRSINRVLERFYPGENRSALRNGDSAPYGITVDNSGMEAYGGSSDFFSPLENFVAMARQATTDQNHPLGSFYRALGLSGAINNSTNTTNAVTPRAKYVPPPRPVTRRGI